MGEFVEVKTAELVGAALDWAVAKATDVPFFQMGENWPGNSAVNEASRLGPVVIMDLTGKLRFEGGSCFVAWSPSTDWSQGGPLIEARELTVEPSACDWRGVCVLWRAQEQRASNYFEHTNLLVAAMRAVVHAKLGETVSIPRELLP